jgi:hypothetical protein
MLNKDDVKIIDHKVVDGKTTGIAAVRAPMAVPATAGVRGTVIMAFIVAAMLMPFFAPAYLLQIAVFNGFIALGWYTLYRGACSAAARHRNELTIMEIMNSGEIEAQITDIMKEIEGNLPDSDLSNEGKDAMENEGGPVEPSELKSGE